MHIALIVALAQNRVIGRNNQLPWYLPNDLKYFKRVTMGKPVIMGRKTFESIGKPLPGRTNIVVSRQADYRLPDGVRLANSLDQALDIAAADALVNSVDEIMVIGGAELYNMALPRVNRLYMTQVHADIEGDAYFPDWQPQLWREVARESFAAEGPNPYDYSFVVLERIDKA